METIVFIVLVVLLFGFSGVARAGKNDCLTIRGARWLGLTSEDIKKGKAKLCDVDLVSSMESKAGRLLAGEHDLYRLSEGTDIHGDGVYFMFAGGGSVDSEPIVKFLWKTNEGHYQISTLPATKLRVEFKDVKTPTIKFRWIPGEYDYTYQQLMDNKVIYAVVTISEKDWSRKFKLLD